MAHYLGHNRNYVLLFVVVVIVVLLILWALFRNRNKDCKDSCSDSRSGSKDSRSRDCDTRSDKYDRYTTDTYIDCHSSDRKH